MKHGGVDRPGRGGVAVAQSRPARRPGRAARGHFERGGIQPWLPTQLTPAELDALIESAIAATGASGARDMGKLMAALKPQLAGRADMAAVSARIKQRLG